MDHKPVTWIMVCFMLLVMLVACSPASTPVPPTNTVPPPTDTVVPPTKLVSFPIGQYLDSSFNVITFEDGGKYTARNPYNGRWLIYYGQYTVDGDIITFLDEGCPKIEGVYRWRLSESGFLHFERIDDTCMDRQFDAGLRPGE